MMSISLEHTDRTRRKKGSTAFRDRFFTDNVHFSFVILDLSFVYARDKLAVFLNDK
jgi:hypothetical protein